MRRKRRQNISCLVVLAKPFNMNDYEDGKDREKSIHILADDRRDDIFMLKLHFGALLFQ